VVAIICVLAAILFPVFAKAREAARSTSCQNNLRQIGLALQLYAEDYGGAFPPVDDDLTPLIPRYLQEPQVFECPSAMSVYYMMPGKGSTEAGPWTAQGGPPGGVAATYLYAAGRTVRSRGHLGLVADIQTVGQTEVHNERGNVLLVNGRVVSIRSEERPAHGLPKSWEPTQGAPSPSVGPPGMPAPMGPPGAPGMPPTPGPAPRGDGG